MLHDALWRSNLDLARSCLAHPFVQALGDGSLSADRFRGFVAQDTFFLRAFQKAYALALARSEDAETIAGESADRDRWCSGGPAEDTYICWCSMRY